VPLETERAGLCEFLEMQREALINKVQGLSEEDARRSATVSSLSLLSLIKHSAIWERRWSQVIAAGDVPTERKPAPANPFGLQRTALKGERPGRH
jgi:Protein of unknown function (DUF664)